MNRTKNIIIDAFWQLLEQKPFSKITVKDIVDICQLNRNTFYYHFHDIPELLEFIVKRDADSIIQTHHDFNSPMDCLTRLLESCAGRRKAILHIYRSVHREAFLNELDRIAYYVVTQYINTVTANLTLPPEDRELFIRFYKCTITGIFLDWLNAGMEYDLSAHFMRICFLFDDAGRQAFLKSAELVPGQ